jgi:hypothetical protein
VTGDGASSASGAASPAPSLASGVAAVRADSAPHPSLDPTPLAFIQELDEEWLQWTVVEVEADGVPGAQGARCLVFSRPSCIRRVWNYPVDWRTLDAAGLAALSWQR